MKVLKERVEDGERRNKSKIWWVTLQCYRWKENGIWWGSEKEREGEGLGRGRVRREGIYVLERWEWWGLERKTQHMLAHGVPGPLPKTIENNVTL